MTIICQVDLEGRTRRTPPENFGVFFVACRLIYG